MEMTDDEMSFLTGRESGSDFCVVWDVAQTGQCGSLGTGLGEEGGGLGGGSEGDVKTEWDGE